MALSGGRPIVVERVSTSTISGCCDPGHQQDIGLLCSAALRGLRTSDALAFRVHEKGKARASSTDLWKLDKMHRREFVIVNDHIPHVWTFTFASSLSRRSSCGFLLDSTRL